jgi:hypothetical protein
LEEKMNFDNKPPQEELVQPRKTFDEKRDRLADIVRIAVLIWSASLLTASYIELPNGRKIIDFDPTFIASIFSGSLVGFGIAPIKNLINQQQLPQAPAQRPLIKKSKEEDQDILPVWDTKK